MPAKNTIKRYAESGYYHLYNRGVAKNLIFANEQDYGVFLHYLKEYLSPPEPPTEEEVLLMRYPYLHRNYHKEIELLSFCLMPNHFHLLLKQLKDRTITFFMQSLCARYTQYFNRSHQRVGHLFQGVYKGILVEQDEYLWWLSRYIHRNPLEILEKNQKLENYSYSSYPAYLGLKQITWVVPDMILGNIKNYRDFVEDTKEKAPETLPDLVLDAQEED